MFDINNLTRRDAMAMGEGFKEALATVGSVAVSEDSELATKAASAAYMLASCYPDWTPDGHFTAGRVWNKNGLLYYCRQDHDGLNDPNRAPEMYAAGWYPIPDPSEDGSMEHPYTWRSGMEGKFDKYYKEDDLLCRCTRGVPAGYLFGTLQSFVGSYMEVVS